MFFHESNASKFALIKLMEHLHKNNIEWLDTQVITPVVKDLGGREYLREDFISLLKTAISKKRPSSLFT